MEDLQPTDEVTILLRGIPYHLRRDFKSWCAMNDTNMTAAIIKLMEFAMDEEVDLKNVSTTVSKTGESKDKKPGGTKPDESKDEEPQRKVTQTSTPNPPRIETPDGKRVCLHWAIKDTARLAKVTDKVAYAAIQVHRDRKRVDGVWMENVQPALKRLSTPEGRNTVVEELEKMKMQK